MPLNSPAYYAPYNGAVEKAPRELKERIDRKLAANPVRGQRENIEDYAEAATHDLNHL